MISKLPVYFTFYKQTFTYSLAAGLGMYLITSSYLDYSQKLKISLFALGCIGLLIFLIVNETKRTNNSFFYLNKGLTKLQLYSFSVVSNLILTFVIFIILK